MSEDWAWLEKLEAEFDIRLYHYDTFHRKDIRKLISAIRQMKEALEFCIDCENGYPERLSHHSKTARETLARLAKAPQEETK